MSSILAELRERFRVVLADLVDDPGDLLAMIRPAQDARFGDYQANCAMPLGKRLGKPPRDVAAEIVEKVDVADLCDPPEIAGPGFINLRLQDQWLVSQLAKAVGDDRLGIAAVSQPRTFVIDYSSPNVAKPMHVGHIRSTVIGDALCRTLRFLGHTAISDNHLGDWGTQFGMIIYGYKHFVDRDAFEKQPVTELGRLYKLVNQLVDYHNGKEQLPKKHDEVATRDAAVKQQEEQPLPDDKAAAKKARKALSKLKAQAAEARSTVDSLEQKLASVEADPVLSGFAGEHPNIPSAVLEETAKLHAGDPENRQLWDDFLPNCRDEIQRVYSRLDIKFDHEHGESFYHDRLGGVVEELEAKGLARESAGATCVFLDGFETPMIVRKKDGAFLYATSDLATIQYRLQEWQPDEILYVVDHRQSEHFDKLFAASRLLGYDQVGLKHIAFGTVLGKDGKPYRTRSGDTVGLEGLLDAAVAQAHKVVCESDDAKRGGPELPEDERRHVADVIGHAAIKYADLSHNRTSDYEFDEQKMVAMSGNTATYMQYSYARVNGIFNKGGVTRDELRERARLQLDAPAERALGLQLLRLADALADTIDDYRPNLLTSYLFELTKVFFTFYEQCPVLKAETDDLRDSRLLLCDLTGQTIKQGLGLLGIDVVSRM